MTIAAAYVSPEGIVLGADSTSTFPGPPDRHYNHAQKIFEIGESSTLGFVTWGVGGLGTVSYRTMVAELDDDLRANPPSGVGDVVQRWKQRFWPIFIAQYGDRIQRFRDLIRMTNRTDHEEMEVRGLHQLSGGFCIAGRVQPDRAPQAYEVVFDPSMDEPRGPTPIPIARPMFWGVPNLMSRLLYCMEDGTFNNILKSGKWHGTPEELIDLLRPFFLVSPGPLPIRDAIDWIHSAIFITIKAMKFSQLDPVCGGPIEIAVITSDRPFRWVTHKGLGEAIHHHTPRVHRE